MKSYLGTLQVLSAGVCFGLIGIFARRLFESGLSVGEILSFRFAIAALVLWVGLLLTKRHLIHLSAQRILICVLLGIFGYAVFSSFYFKAIEGLSVPLAVMLLFTFPIFVNLGGHFFLKEHLNRLQVFSLVIASSGLVILLWGDLDIKTFSGILFALGSSITYSAYVLISGKLQKNINPLSSSLYIITAAALTLWTVNLVPISKVISLSVGQWQLLVAIALISTILPLTLFLAGLQKMRSGRAAILVMIEPVTATVAASLVLGEHLLPQQLAGSAMILLGILVNSISTKQLD